MTARHNVRFDVTDYHIRVNTKDGKSQAVPCDGKWHFHPNPVADVAIMPWSPAHDVFKWDGIPDHMFVGGRNWQDRLYADHSVGPGDEVFACGLFSRRKGEGKNLPIVRIGNIAAMPDNDEPVRTKNGKVPAYLIEARSLGGLSGSPVFLPFQHFQGTPMGFRPAGKHFFLLGLVHGHWPLDEHEDLIVDLEQELGEEDAGKKEQEKINTGIAIVIPVERILETINQPELAEMREKKTPV